MTNKAEKVKLFITDLIPPIILKVRRAVRDKRQHIDYSVRDQDYNAKKYWNDRHKKYGYHSFRAVGNLALTEDANSAWYESARYIFSGILSELGLDGNAKILEIGYGTGFYSEIIYKYGFKNYLGVDIVDMHIDNIEKKIPAFRSKFQKYDVGTKIVDYKNCDLIYLIDVSQHIVNDKKMIFCLKNNVLANLKQGGFFVVTDGLVNQKPGFYVKWRTLDFYEDVLGMNIFHSPLPFRGEYIFSFKK